MRVQQGPAFGVLLRRYRKTAGLTQEELAERARLSAFTISALERGTNHAPRKDTLALLADALRLGPPERAALKAAARIGGSVPATPVTIHSTIPFVGRTRDLALLERHLAGNGPPVLLVAGEPGIGKSRLLAEAHVPAQANGWTVLTGGCQRRGGHEPYAPLLGALQRHVAQQSPRQLRADLAGCAWLVRLLPELTGGPIEPLPDWTLSAEQERRLMVGAVVRFLSNVAGAAGTLLVLDDLQWAGPDALDLLTALVRSAAEVPLRVVGAYRSTEVQPGDPLGIMLADLAYAGLAHHRTLDPLPPEDATHLLTRLLADVTGADPALQRQVVQRAGGVPFFLVSYARGLQAGLGATIPWDLAQGVRQRVAALPEGAQEALGVAAVIGRVVPHRLLTAVLARPEDEVLAALHRARGSQLVREEGAAAYQFVHDVIREVVEADLGVARRTLVHRQVAEALERQPGEPAVELLAYHYTQAQAWEPALDYLVRAGDKAAAAHANQDALDAYAQALAVCEHRGAAALPTVVAAARKRGDLQMLIQRAQDAVGDYDRMAEAARRSGDRHREGLALAYRGQAEEACHAFEVADATLRAALAIGDEGYDDVRQVATLWLAHTLTMSGRKADAAAFLRTVQDLAQQRGDHAMEQALNPMLGLFAVWEGRFADALASTQHTAARLDAYSPAEQCSHQWGMALTWGALGEYQVALALLHDCLALAERIGEVWARRRALNTLGWLYGELQDHARALEWNTRGVEAARERLAPETNPECEHNARLNLGDTLRALGRLEEAEAQFRVVEGVVRAPQPRDRYMLWRYAQHLFHSYGELWLARGEAARALAYAEECLALAEATTSRKNVIKGRRLRGQALLAQGQVAEAERDLDTALRLAQQVASPCQLWRTQAAWGDLRDAQGRAGEKHSAYQAALAIVEHVAAALADESLRETFLTSDHVRQLRQGTGGP